ncbi:TIGR03089 family protein [Corynebacterium timonense]|uniref:TIGR03089 family protein n=1 Tax=Corynebacterium timonense TaxID=441500 RepID=A0A1H1RTQ2_9CORY|nr:TIGR03089 family protein [Corynebacterium timonense]SDS39082.1 TIGR03089 family protein [Corynebacterium timonense]
MSILSPLLRTNPSGPRLTVYDEVAGTRMEFSALTLENWANKVANMLDAEFELSDDARVLIDVPSSWQAAAIALGTYNSSRTPSFSPVEAGDEPDLVFTTLERAAMWTDLPDVVVVSADPFGRGIVESGEELPLGTVDFGPTVRFYGDDYLGASPRLDAWARRGTGAERYRIDPWESRAEFDSLVMAPLAADGSVVLVTGLAPVERLSSIDVTENVTAHLSAR